jgi:hypothetical protein
VNEQSSDSCCCHHVLQLTTPHRRPGLARTAELMRPRQLLAQPMQVAADETLGGTSVVPPVTHGAAEVPITERAPASGCQLEATGPRLHVFKRFVLTCTNPVAP